MSLSNQIADKVRGKYRDVFASHNVGIMFPFVIGSTTLFVDDSENIDILRNRIIGQNIDRSIQTLLIIGGSSQEQPIIDVPKISQQFEDYSVILYGNFGNKLLRQFGRKAVYVDSIHNAAVLTRRLYYRSVIITPLHKSDDIKADSEIFEKVLRYY